MSVELSRPSVSIIVTHHLNQNQAYLDRCIKSILESVNIGFEVIVLASTKEKPQVSEGVTLVWDPALNNATKKINRGVELASDKTDAYLLISDDVILSKYALNNLYQAMNGQDVIMCPCSNSDTGVLYWMDVNLDKDGETKRPPLHASIEDMTGWEDAIIDYAPTTPVMVRQPWIPFFCVMIKKSTWKKVGELDPALDSRHNDQDYCYRAASQGIPTIINFMAYAFHYGSKTLSVSCEPGEQDKASLHFAKKWSTG